LLPQQPAPRTEAGQHVDPVAQQYKPATKAHQLHAPEAEAEVGTDGPASGLVSQTLQTPKPKEERVQQREKNMHFWAGEKYALSISRQAKKEQSFRPLRLSRH
jgi:hypothetical protein